MKINKRKIIIILLSSFLFVFFVFPYLIPVPKIPGTFPPYMLGKEDSKFMTVNGLKVHYKIYGSGEPTIILMHGFGAYTFSFDPIIRDLSKYGTVIAFDRPAFGFTERPLLENWKGPNPYTNEFAADLVANLMDELGISKAIILGHSAGGAVALLTYYRHPDRVAALILEDAAVYGGGAPWYVGIFQYLPQFQRLGPLLIRSIAGDLGINTIYLAWYNDSKITPDIIEGYRRPLMAENWDYALWQYTLASRDLRLSENLSRISVPVLIITGTEDQIIPPSYAERLASEIPGARLVKIEQCGHIPHEEKPKEFLSVVTAFLGSAD
ncbi:MAG: alpha/beta hydrolase [Candidatus Methanomethyliaceae archaeon]|nr:alpha/beta hydrolase [Candidatus Methanomethyliaceae archaeon]